ncbi:MAG TPA: hypothetical protein VN181_09135, partial [Thermoanaerobaculia bacterium]|nr:hypothetical protein [Thermoanaerobaculia bacterium]
PPNITIPWDFDGVIQWTLSGATFASPGITFDAGSPFQATTLEDGSRCELSVHNDVGSDVGIAFHYNILFEDGMVLMVVDPTVELESPPPGGDVLVRGGR